MECGLMIGFLSLTEAVMRAYDRIRLLNVCLTGKLNINNNNIIGTTYKIKILTFEKNHLLHVLELKVLKYCMQDTFARATHSA